MNIDRRRDDGDGHARFAVASVRDAKGPRKLVSIESRSKWIAADRQARLGVIYVRSGRGEVGTREVAPAEGDHG